MRLKSLVGMGLASVLALNGGGIQQTNAVGGEHYSVLVSSSYVLLPPTVVVCADVQYARGARKFIFTIRTRSGYVDTVAIYAPGLKKAIDKLREHHPHATILAVN
ncbi:MAG: hypothetical protein WCJ35_02010 [Planctomycetota bacterium]